MPINAYVGLMGSGKSYEVVSTVIVTAIAAGRRVVSNVDGLNQDEIFAYCHEKHGVAFDKMGTILIVSNDDVKSANFFCFGKDVDTIVQPGDLVCIDEAWRFWGNDCKLHDSHKIFFREHRHYAHAVTSVTCDLCVMVQDIGDLHRILRYVVEMTFKTHKLKSIGLSKNYRVDLYEGYKINAKTKVNSIQKRYDAKVFPLYSSYSGGHGKEESIDKRQNVLLDKKFLFGGIFVFCLLAWSLPTVYYMFNPKPVDKKLASQDKSSTSVSLPVVVAPIISTWRITGYLRRSSGETIVYLTDDRGFVRPVVASAFVLDGFQTSGYVDGQLVSFWSGVSTVKSSPFGLSK